MINHNPLRYPGGKHFLARYIEQVLASHDLLGCTFYEPYAGSAAVSLALLANNAIDRAVIVERDPLIYSFWSSVMRFSDELCQLISDVDISLETWHAMSNLRRVEVPNDDNLLQLGLAGLFLTRTSYSGILKAGPLGGNEQKSPYGIGCRFNKEAIIGHVHRISREYAGRLTVIWGDAITYMRENQDEMEQMRCFVYIDPPYYQQGKRLYRHFYRDRDHEELANFIIECGFPWLVSYDDHPFINELYVDQQTHIQGHFRDYSAGSRSTRKRERELLISNRRIPPTRALRSAVAAADD